MLIAMQEDHTYRGQLQLNVFSEITSVPIENATINISYTGVPQNQLEQLRTDASGQTETIDLPSPPL